MSRTPRFKPVKTRKGWRLNIPAVLSATGKRSRRFFKSRELTEGFAQKLRVQIAQYGTRILPPAQTDAAVRAFRLLGSDATPEMLLDAVRQYVKGAQLQSALFEDAFEAFTTAQPRSTSYNQSLRQFRARLAVLHGRLLCDISARDVEEAMGDFPPSVFNFGLRILGGLFNYARKRDLCVSNPIGKLDRKKLPPREVEIYTPHEVTSLLEASAPSLLPWLCSMMFAGLRASEARQMVWSDFDFSENFIRVRALVSKTHRPRAIALNRTCASGYFHIVVKTQH